MVGFNPSTPGDALPTEAHALAGATSGCITRGLFQPLDVIKIRFQLQVEPISKTAAQSKYQGLAQAVKCILGEEGPTALWKGHVPAQLLSVVYGSVQFMSFEMMTRFVWQHLPSRLTTDIRPMSHFVCGSMSGCLATLACHPFDVIRTRFVAQGKNKVYRGILDAGSSIVRQEGFPALYKGLLPTLIQVAPQTGFQFGFYTMFTMIWHFVMREEGSIGGVQSIVCGSGAGICAKVAVYPLDMVKKRLQIQGFGHGRQEFGATHYYRGFLHCIRKVAWEEGLQGLYKGLTPSVIKAACTVGSHFFLYEQCCQVFKLLYHQLAR